MEHPVDPSALRPGAYFGFCLWASSLVRLILKSGTSFAVFLKSTLPLCRGDGLSAPTALFPLPLPFDGLFAKRSRRRTQKRRLPHLRRVALHVLVMALNFLFTDGKHIPADVLRRPPSSDRSRVFDRLMGLVRASVRLSGNTVHEGRKGLQLAARQAEVLTFLRSAGVQEGCYAGTAEQLGAGYVGHLPGGPEELTPYRDLDASRIALSGTGSWDLSEFLDPGLVIPYLEPSVLRTFEPSPTPGPSFHKDSKEQVFGLFRKWDELGVLALVPGPRDDSDLTRVFGAFKDSGRDRQIGDSRNVNNKEARITDGPSHRLPAGSVLTRLTCPRWTYALYGSCVDRKDFYHQAAGSYPRAVSNAIGPVFDLRVFRGFQAHAEYIARGDRAYAAASSGDTAFKPSSILAHAGVPVHGAFKSLLQGDHLGVEFAASAHEGLLRGSGITGDPPGGRLLNRCPVASNVTRWAGLIIDDLFAISAEEVGPGGASTLSGPRPFSARLKSFTRLLALRGPTKRTSSVPGCSLSLALKSTPPPRACLREVFVGLPASRRFALSFASLQVAAERYISEELASALAGCWVTALLYRRCLMLRSRLPLLSICGSLRSKRAGIPGLILPRPVCLPPTAVSLSLILCLTMVVRSRAARRKPLRFP